MRQYKEYDNRERRTAMKQKESAQGIRTAEQFDKRSGI